MSARTITLIAAAIAVLLQVLVAPIIQIGSVVPNFLVVFVIALAIVRPPETTYVYAFVLGLLSDLLANTPVGLSPLLLLIVCFAMPRVFNVLDDTTPVMPVVALASTVFVYELVVMIFLLATGYPAGWVELFTQRMLPLFLYDALAGVLVYFLVRRFVPSGGPSEAWTVSEQQRYR